MNLIHSALDRVFRPSGASVIPAEFLTTQRTQTPVCVFRHGKRRPDELTVDEINDVFRQFRALGGTYVHLWGGGEPSIHPQIGDIIRAAKDNDLYVGMISNGAQVAKKIDQMRGVDRFNFSVDAPNAKDHNRFRQTPGLYERVMDAVAAIKNLDPNKSILFSYTLSRDNQHMVGEMATLCSELGVYLYVNPMREAANLDDAASAANGDPNHKSLEQKNTSIVMSFKEQVPVWELLMKLKNSGYPIYNSRSYMREMICKGLMGENILDYACHWPEIAIEVTANGDVINCTRWNDPVTNLRIEEGVSGKDAGLKSMHDILSSARMEEFRKLAESCHVCISPNRYDPSRTWDGDTSVIWSFLTGPFSGFINGGRALFQCLARGCMFV